MWSCTPEGIVILFERKNMRPLHGQQVPATVIHKKEHAT
jgi:5,10-methylene-tetrahydrofolate dehydrogenase/methenyl tetrahydrofolate cyclohydrolase